MRPTTMPGSSAAENGGTTITARLHVLISIVSALPSLAFIVILTLVPDFFWIAISRQIDPGAALRPRVVPPVIVVMIVETTVDIVWVHQFHNYRKGRRDGDAGAARSRSHNARCTQQRCQ